MPLYKPSELASFLDRLGAHPNKNLSQNFLIDGNVLDKIIKAADLKPNDLVVEIGPGPGALTEKLLESGCQVIAIEIDRLFAANLFKHERLTVYHADALDFAYDFPKAKVVSNLPYNVTTPILERLVTCPNITDCIVMIQADTAKRFLQAHDYFSLFLQYHATLTYCFNVSRGSFYPKPHVDSAVIHLKIEKRLPVKDEGRFLHLLQVAFLHKRKMLKKSLKEYASNIEEALVAIGKPKVSRPEELTLDDWTALFLKLTTRA